MIYAARDTERNSATIVRDEVGKLLAKPVEETAVRLKTKLPSSQPG